MRRIRFKNFDFIGQLPPELVQIIFLELPPIDLRNALRASHLWTDLASSEYFWKRKCRLDKYLKPSGQHQVFDKIVAGRENIWERTYMYNEILFLNWRNNNYVESYVDLPVCVNSQNILHYFDDEIFIMTNMENKLIIVNHLTKEYIERFHSFRSRWCENIFLRKSLDFIVYFNLCENRLRVWDIKNGNPLVNMVTDMEVEDMVVHNNLAFFLFKNCSCVIIDIMTSIVVYPIENYEECTCACFFDDKVAFAIKHGKVKIINWETKATVAIIDFNFQDIIKKMLVSGDFLICFVKTHWYVWNMKTCKMLHSMSHTLDGNYADVFLIGPTIMLMRNTEYMFLEAVDFITTNKKYCINDFRLGMKFKFNDHYIFVVAYHIIKFYCINTGRFVGEFTMKFKLSEIFVTNRRLSCLNLFGIAIRDYEKEISEEHIKSLICPEF